MTTIETPEWWAIRGLPRHLTGDFMQGETDETSGETPRRSGRPFLKEERPAACKEIGFPYNLLLGAK